MPVRGIPMLSGVALLLSGLLPPVVSYETLAKPLPDILEDVSRMVGKKVTCDRELASDRLCIFVTDVDPHDLLDRIVLAVGGKVTEDARTITVLPDGDFEKKILERRNAAIPRLHAAWTSELGQAVNVVNEKIDLHELADIVTADVLTALPTEGKVVFSRPLEAGARPIPVGVPDFYTRFQTNDLKRQPWSGMRVTLTSTRSYIQLSLAFLMKTGQLPSVYFRHFTPYFGKPDSFFSKWVEPGGDVSRRRSRFVFSSDSDGTVSTDGFDAFAGRPWGSEPLNAITAPVLVNAAKVERKNLVAFLDDEAIARKLPPPPALAYLLLDDFRLDEDGWVVGQVIDPRAARERRADRTRLSDIVARSKQRGYIEFWDYIQYRSSPGSANDGAMVLEAAAIGPFAFTTCPSARQIEFAAAFEPLHKSATLWNAVTSEQGVPAKSLPAPTRDYLGYYFKTTQFIVGRLSSGIDVSNAGKTMSVAEAGLNKQIPPDAGVRIVVEDVDWLFGVNKERRYATMTPYVRYAFSVAQSEAGKGSAGTDAYAGLKEFVPCVQHEMWFELSVNGYVFRGPGIIYIEPVDGVVPRTIDKFPTPHKDRMDTALAEARKRAGGG